MKASVIKKLEQASMYYKRIEACLNDAYDKAYDGPTEYFHFLDGTTRTTASLIFEMLSDAINERVYIEGKIEVFNKEYKE